MSCSCVSKRWVSSWLFYIGLIWLYGSSKNNGFAFFSMFINFRLMRICIDVSVFFLKYFGHDPFLWLFWRRFYLADFFLMNNGPLKVKFSSFLPCCINNYITPLLLSIHTIKSYFRYIIDELLGIWKYPGWYCWLVFLCWYCWLVFCVCVCWCWFGTFWCWNVFTKYRFTMG